MFSAIPCVPEQVYGNQKQSRQKEQSRQNEMKISVLMSSHKIPLPPSASRRASQTEGRAEEEDGRGQGEDWLYNTWYSKQDVRIAK